MLHTLQSFFDFLFPPSTAARLLRTVHDSDFIHFSSEQRAPGARYLLSYEIPAVQAAITASKFEHHQRAATLLGSALERYLAEQTEMPTCVVPIPLSPRRLRRRGHNQVETILKHTPLPDWCTINTKLLTRVRDTAPQTSLARNERLKNVADAFVCNPKAADFSQFARILIVDDVTTTGATLGAAKASLLPHTNLPIICVALAH